ncbi:MAG: cobaltochelatase subunit CobS, partial [Acetobacteraceae bacterium]
MNKVAALADIRPTSAIDVPDTEVSAREAFGIDTDMVAPAFSIRTEHVPDVDLAYKFDKETTLAIVAGFAFNRRVMIQG